MSTKGILKAGDKLQTNITGASNYDLKVGGINLPELAAAVTLGPYDDDQFYELTVNSGLVSVGCYNALINSVIPDVKFSDLGMPYLGSGRKLSDGTLDLIKANGVEWYGDKELLLVPRRQPGETSAQLLVRIQSYLDLAESIGGGIVKLENTGATYLVDGAVKIGDNVTLDANGAKLLHDTGVADNVIRTKAYDMPFQPITLTWTAGQLVTVTTTAPHGLSVGDYYAIADGLTYGSHTNTSPSTFLGTFRVASVTDSLNFVVQTWCVPTGAPSGVFGGKKATVNIGVKNLRYATQLNSQSPAGIHSMGILLAHAANPRIENVRPSNIRKYCIFGFGVYNGYVNGLYADKTLSDGVHWFGPCCGITTENVSGYFADDSVTMSSRDVMGIYSDVSCGDLIDIHFKNAHSYSETSAAQMYSHYGYKIDNVSYDSITGGNAAKNIMIYGDSVDGGQIGRLTLKNLVLGQSVVNFTYYAGTPAGKTFYIDDLVFDGVTLPNTQALSMMPINISAGATVRRLTLKELVHTDALFGAGATCSILQPNGTIKTVVFRDCVLYLGTNGRIISASAATGLEQVIFEDSTVSGGNSLVNIAAACTDVPTVTLSRSNISSMYSVISASNNAKVHLDHSKISTINQGIVTLYNALANAVVISQVGCDITSAVMVKQNSTGLVSPTKNTGLECDITLCNRIDGAMVYNTNAAANNGTDGAIPAGPYVCVGTAVGSWKKMGTVGGANAQY